MQFKSSIGYMPANFSSLSLSRSSAQMTKAQTIAPGNNNQPTADASYNDMNELKDALKNRKINPGDDYRGRKIMGAEYKDGKMTVLFEDGAKWAWKE